MRELFFQAGITLAVVLFLVNFWLLVRWRRGGSPRPLLAGVLVAVVLLATEALVVTPHERASAALADIERDLIVEKIGGLARQLHPDFAAEDWDRREFLKAAEQRFLRRVRIRSLRRTRLEIEDRSPARFTAGVSYLADVSVGNFSGYVKARTQLYFARTDDGVWKIIGVDPPEGDSYKIRSWKSFRP